MILNNLIRYKDEFYSTDSLPSYKHLSKRFIGYITSESVLLHIIKKWDESILTNWKRVQNFFEILRKAMENARLIPDDLKEDFNKIYDRMITRIHIQFPKIILDYVKVSKIGDHLDFKEIFKNFKNKDNIPEDKSDPVQNFKWTLIDLIESDTYLMNEFQWFRSSFNYNADDPMNFAKSFELLKYYTQPIEVLKHGSNLDASDYRECSLSLINNLILELQSRSFINYWLDRYCQRSQHFNRSFYAELLQARQKGKKFDEELCCQHYLLYLYDNGVDFTYNQHKQGFRPDFEQNHSVIEAKLIRKDDSESSIRADIKKAIKEVNLQSKAHPSIEKYILIYNASEQYLLYEEIYDGVYFKIVDFGIALYNDSPSQSKRKILSIKDLLDP